MRLAKLLFFCLTFQSVFGQNRIAGNIADNDGAPLAFVSILVNDDREQGILSDIDGHFEVVSKVEIQSLTFRCVGFELLKLEHDFLRKQSKNSQNELEIRLKPIAGNIAEVVIRPGENPAHRIVRLAVKHREENDPERLAGFRCQTYQKVAFDFLPDSAAFEKFARRVRKRANLFDKMEKRFKKADAQADSMHAFLTESATELRFKFPDRRQETVILSRASGFKEAFMTLAGTQVQPFSFSRDFLPIMGFQFLNPISPNSPEKYHFLMEDTLFVGHDTVWNISFYPRKGHAFEGLKGRFSINSNNYALQNMVVVPNDRKLLAVELEQEFSFLTDAATGFQHWFPTQMNYVIIAKKYPSPYTGLQAVGRNRMTNVQFNPVFLATDFDPLQPLSMEKSAIGRDSGRWESLRLEPLSRKDLTTYRIVDSIGDRRNFDRMANIMAILSSGLLPVGNNIPVRIDINKVLKFNTFERARIGIGLTSTNTFAIEKRKSPWLWNGWVGYGLRDKTWKGASTLRLRLRRESETYAALTLRQELLPPGALATATTGLISNNFYAEQLDDLRDATVEMGSRVGPSLFFSSKFTTSRDRPRYNYFYTKNDVTPDTIREFRLTELGFFVRFQRQQTGQLILGQPVATASRWPLINVGWTRGFDGILGGQFSYDRFEITLQQRTPIRGLGRLDWRFDGGVLRGGAPVARHFTLNTNNGGGFALFSFGQTFQNVDTLFLSDRFANFYFQQTIGTPFWRKPWSKPLVSIIQNAAVGWLKNPERHGGIGFVTPTKGLFETGIKIDDLVRINYLNAVRLGLGFGVFSRWGEFASPNFGENISFRLGFRVGL